ncbi:MAG TPA: formate dehydrogenase accessory sulfurtransferase FdhD [Methanocorpusculum sp.]|nr:formate dehydrogenase accessory sulfurtransferase FdhD [Methanocorpusculum sp.]
MTQHKKPAEESDMIQKQPAMLWSDGNSTEISDIVACEDEIVLYLNGKEYLHIVASCDMLEEFGAGFFIAAGAAKKILTVKIAGNNVFVEAEMFDDLLSAEKKDQISAKIMMDPQDIFAIRESMDVEVWRQTGGLHCATLWHDHQIVAISSDVGRHNAVDKVIGSMILQGIDPSECVLGCTGRLPKGMVMKAVNAGIPIIVGRTAVTYPGAVLAKEEGITLIGFARENRFTVYSHPERIAGFPSVESKDEMDNDDEAKLSGWRYDNGKVTRSIDPVVTEGSVTLYLNGEKYLDNVGTLEFLDELGAGFFVAAGIAKNIHSVKVAGSNIYVEAGEISEVCYKMESAGGFCPRDTSVRVKDVGRITPEEIFTIRRSINTEQWDQTGALHCAVLYYRGEVIFSANDIGRHNAVDKVIGHMVLDHLEPEECVLGCTGRMPQGMIAKIANSGIPIIVSRAAATSAGVCLAERSGITLICFARPPRFTVYTHPERITGLMNGNDT